MTEPTVSHTPSGSDPTLGALVHDLTTQVPELIRSEIRLAQAEVAEKGKRAGIGIGMFSGAGLLAFFGARDRRSPPSSSPSRWSWTAWLAALIVAVVLFAGAGVLALMGKNQVRGSDAARARTGRRGRQGRHRDREGTALMSTPEEIQADIERQREHLAQTVDQLGHKLDVKAQTKEKVADVRDRATTDDGKPRPEVLGAAAAVVLGLGLVIWLRRRR